MMRESLSCVRDWLFVRIAFSFLVPSADVAALIQVSAEDDTGH